MKKIFLISTSLILLTACGGNMQSENEEATEETTVTAPDETQSDEESEEQPINEDSFEESELNNSEQEEHTDETSNEDEEAELLDKYSTEEIEYARVWLEIKDDMDIEELEVSYISEGEPVNQYDEESVGYPEDVVLLAGVGVAGSPVIIYSSNGDGTINLYDIPSHWPSEQQIDETMAEYTRDIVENTEEVYIDTGNAEEVDNLIQKIQVEE